MISHIGIVGVSPEGAALFFRQVTRALARRLGQEASSANHPRLTLHNKPIGLYLDALKRGDWEAIAGLLSRSAALLAEAGADFCVTPDHAVQHGVHSAADASPIPWISMPELVAERLADLGAGTVGIIGTSWVTRASTYQTLLGLKGIKLIAPPEAESQRLDAIVFDELVYGRVDLDSAAFTRSLLGWFADRGCEGVILASSEIPLLLTGEEPPLPLHDASEILAAGVVERALAATSAD